ncbi:MAG: hypothetical protein BroJett011_17290 [Chloroflexota bacterium]|nr:MAG: hypothetical protein BroJett011_17290 [Chloroflexota bacterium]
MHIFKRRLRLFLLLLFVAVFLLTCRVERKLYGVWELSLPGLSVTALRDTYTGLVLWIYTGNQFRGQWKAGQWLPAGPVPYPTATPYPTSTPYPTPTRGLPLQGA